MKRVIVVGLSGSGKTTLAAALAARIGAPHVELDGLFWEPGWVPADTEVFRARVDQATAGESWVVCGNYWNKLGPYLWHRADTVVWLDLPLGLMLWRSIRRTVLRALTRSELWNGNREHLGHLWASDALWRYTLANRNRLSERYEGAMADSAWSHLTFVRLRRPAEVRRWLGAVESSCNVQTAAGRDGDRLSPGRSSSERER